MIEHLKSAARSVAGLAGDTLSAGMEHLKESLVELSAASEDLEQLGYQLGQIEVSCSIPPRLIVFMARQGKASAEAYQAMLAKHEKRTTVKTVIHLLQMGDKLVEQVKIPGRSCTYLGLELGIPPSVRLIYDPPASAAGLTRPVGL